MKILYMDTALIVCRKPAGIPSQSDLSGDRDAMNILSEMLSEIGEQNKLWLVHRLDRVVGGVMVFARTSRSAAFLSKLVSEHKLHKEYIAVIEGKPDEKNGVLEDYLYKDCKNSKAYVVKGERKGVKKAVLEYEVLKTEETPAGCRSLVRICLHTGRFHQIRAQFSSRCMPLVGDGKYGSKDNRCLPALYASKLSFPNPVTHKNIDISSYPDFAAYPWNIFGEK